MSTSTIKKMKVTVILFYAALFIGLALFDEKPFPGMMREMERPRPETIGPGNAWVAFIGFAAPKGIAPYAWGEEKLQKLKNAIVAKARISSFLDNNDDYKQELLFQGKRPVFYSKKDEGIVAYGAAHASEVAELIRKNRELLRRYESLSTYSRYDEPLDYGFYTPFPSFSPIRDAQRLKLIQLAGQARQGDVAGALAGVRKDMEFWRFVARNSTTVLSKIISIAILSTDLRFAAELGTFRALNDKEQLVVQNILRPFDRGEIGLTKALQGEARYMYKGSELTIDQSSGKLDKFFFKRNATNNRMYADFQEYIRLAELTPQKFAIAVKKREGEHGGIRRIGLPFLYNPAGEILSIIGQGLGFYRYVEKGHNLEGLRRLAWLKVLIRRKNVPQERVQQFLDAHAGDLGNPYTGGPMKWDLKKSSIFFNDVSGDKAVEIFL